MILAKDEAQVLADTIRLVQHQLGARGALHVVADGCRDGTAAVARGAGAIVHDRPAGNGMGKGAALAWWLRRTHRSSSPDQVIVVLDADSRIAPGFIDAVRSSMAAGSQALQARVVSEHAPRSAIAQLAALSETAEQIVVDAVRSRLGWPVRLRGTGMAFRRSVLEAAAAHLRTTIEDAELSLLLTAEGVRVQRLETAQVIDPKPSSVVFAAQQRARWLKGQMQLPAAQPRALLRTLARGPAGWSLAASVLLKPKALVLPAASAAALALWQWGGADLWMRVPAALLTLWVALQAIQIVAAVPLTAQPLSSARAILLAPAYLVLWLGSAALALACTEPWPRARPLDIATRPAGEPGHAR